jgi:hypothetical protein
MTTVKVEAKPGEAADTYIVVEHIVRADFYISGRARNQAYAMVYTPDGKDYRVDGEQALALEQTLARAQLKPTR